MINRLMRKNKNFWNIRRFGTIIFFALVNLNFIYAQSITVTLPNGGETLTAGTNFSITWTSSGVSNVSIDVSNNGGLNWVTIITNVPSPGGGSYLWTVDNTPTTRALIRVRKNSTSDVSNSFFFIRSLNQFDPNNTIKLLPIGNSITFDAFRAQFIFAQDKISYRYNLWDSLRTNNYNIDFIGHHPGGYAVFPDPENEGVPGINASETKYLLSNGYDIVGDQQITPGPYLNYFSPDILLIHVGTNDIGKDINTTVNTISTIIDNIQAYDVSHGDYRWIVLALIIQNYDTLNQPSLWVTNFNNALNAMAQLRIATWQRILVVDMGNALTSSDFVDGTHPNNNGKLKMANIWYQGLKLILPNSTASAPNIISAPDTLGYLGLPYRYNVNATGVGAPNYSLTTSPAGMAINMKTGIIDWVPASIGTFPVSVKAKNSTDSTFQDFNITVLPQPTLTNNIISYWKLDETGSPSAFKDLPGVNDAVPISAPTATTGIVNGALSFNGSTKVDALDDSSLYFYPSESFSIEMWVKTTQTGFGDKIFLGKNGGDTKFSLGLSSSNLTKFQIEDSTGALTFVTRPTISNGNWHHVVGVLDRANDSLKIYVDSVGSSIFKSFHPSGFLSYDPLTFGYYKYTNSFIGLLDEVAIYNRALTQR